MRSVVLTLHHPWRRSHGGSLRTRAVIGALLALGHEVTCVHPGPAGEGPPGLADIGTGSLPAGQRSWPDRLQTTKRRYLPMPTVSGGRDHRLAEILEALAPVDLLVVGELAGIPYRRTAGAGRLWIDFPDLLSAAATRHGDTQRRASRLTARAQAALLARQERRVASGEDVIVTAAGWGDARTLSARASREVQWLPTPVAGPLSASEPEPAARRTAGFLGNFAHLPNLDGYAVLCQSWAPRLQERGWSVVVAGHDSDRLPPCRQVERLGPLPSVGAFYDRVAVTLAPLRLGGGMKVKVVESLAYGRPVAAAPAVLDGFPAELHRHITAVDLHWPDFSSLPDSVRADAAVALSHFAPERFVTGVARALGGLPQRTPA